MKELAEKGSYTITEEMKEKLGDFYGNYCSEGETKEAISAVYYGSGYVLDPHTAVAGGVYQKYLKETGDDSVTVIASTASPYKFTRSVVDAISDRYQGIDDLQLSKVLEELSKVPVPKAVKELMDAPVLHDRVIAADEMAETVKTVLGI